jgi:outer membrane lipoprotein-sorting protein
MRRALILGLLAIVALAARGAGALTLDALMRQMAAVSERHGAFVETKEMALLNGPLVRRGTLDYTRPDRLSMRVDSPYFERVDVVGDQVTLERRSGTTRVALSSQPQLAAWIDSLRATLAGDGATLERHFEVRVDGTDADWRLSLVPRDAALRAMIERVDVAGRGAEVTRFAIDEAKGDRTRIVITPRGP